MLKRLNSKFFTECKTFRPNKNWSKGKHDELYNLKLKTLGSKWSTRETVILPDGENEDDWLAMNTVDFYNQINVVYGALVSVCTEDDCPVMSAGDRYTYYWADGKKVKKAIKLSAPDYVDHLMEWVQDQLDDPELFPTDDDVEFPKEFYGIVCNIFRKLFRIYAHIYHSHFDYIVEVGEDAHINACFKHFIFFVKEFELIEDKELAPLSSIIKKLMKHK